MKTTLDKVREAVLTVLEEKPLFQSRDIVRVLDLTSRETSEITYKLYALEKEGLIDEAGRGHNNAIVWRRA